MTSRRPYTYTVLRYVHDVMTGEFVNVGVVLHSPSAQFLGARTRHTIGRIKDVFPDLDRESFKTAMQGVESAIRKFAREEGKGGLLPQAQDAAEFARMVLPHDASSLRWSPVGAGLTHDPTATLDRLFERMVARYDINQRSRLSDDDVWRPVRQKLEERNVADRLGPKVIQGAQDDITFKHAWKNGMWHCYEPVSLDLANGDGIKDKARRLLGHLTAVADSPEPFKTYFIVAAPKDPKLASAYRSAVGILQKTPLNVEVYEESQVDDLVEVIEDEVRAHDAV